MSSRLGEILVKDSLISQDQLKQALDYQKKNGGRLGTCLVKMGLVSDDDITAVLSRQYGVPSINLKFYEVDPAVIKLVPQETAVRYQIVPLSRVGSTLTIAMTDPTNVFAMDDIKFMTGFNVEPVVASETAISEAIHKFYGDAESVEELDKVMKDLTGEDTDALELAERRSRNGLGLALESRRRSSHHQAVQPDPDGRGEARSERHPRRAVRKRIPRPLPHRRNSAERDGAAHEVEGRDDQPHQDHVQAGHQRKAAAARRPHHDQVPEGREEEGTRLPRLDCPHALRRKNRSAVAGQRKPSPGHDQAGLRARVAGEIRKADSEAVRHGAGHRSDRIGQDEHAVFVGRAPEYARNQHHDRRRSGRVPAARNQPGADEGADRAELRVRAARLPAAGPEHHPGRRNSRLRDGRNRGEGGAHRPLGALDAAHERRAFHDQPLDEHGYRAVPGGDFGEPDLRATAWCAASACSARSRCSFSRRP